MKVLRPIRPRFHPIYGLTDVLQETESFLSFDFHALATAYGNKIEAFILPDAGEIRSHLPFRVERQEIISHGQRPIVESYSLPAHRDRTEAKKGTIKKPQDQDQPDAEHHGVFSPFPDDGVNEEKEDHTERNQHHGILDKKGLDDESLCIHTNALGITHR